MQAQAQSEEKLESAVKQVYQVFSRHAPPTATLDACLACCMPAELEEQMRRLPLTKLTAEHFYQYNIAAKSEVQPAAELLYLLPRMLELMAEGAEVHHATELSLDRLGRCPVGSLGGVELNAVNQFAQAYFELKLGATDRLWSEDPICLLLMFDIGGVAIAPMLDHWTQSEQPESTMHFVDATYWHFWEQRDYANAFAADRTAFKSQFRNWALDPKNRLRFADRLMQPDFLRLAQAQECRGQMPFSTMVDAVFDQLTQ